MQFTKQQKDYIAYLLTLLIYLPSTTGGSLVRMLAAVIVYVLSSGFQSDENVSKLTKKMLLSPFIPAALVLVVEHTIAFSTVTHESMRMIYAMILMLSVSRIEVSFDCVYRCCILALIPNLGIQVLQSQGNPTINGILNQYYMTTTDSRELLILREMMSSRFGSIFINPNVYMVIPLISLVVFLQKDRKKSGLINYLLIGCCMISCYYTGSRTSTVVMSVMFAYYLFKYTTGEKKIRFGFLLILFIILFGSSFLKGSRMLDIENVGKGNGSDSLYVKYMQFIWYWQSTAFMPLYWITGSIGSLRAHIHDSELGRIYGWYGLYGLGWYIQYYKLIYYRNSEMLYYSKMIAIACFLVSLTASVLLCMPLFSFVVVLAFASVSNSDEFIEEM